MTSRLVERELEREIERRVTEHCAEWFPDAPPRSPVRLRQLSSRPRAALYSVYVGDRPRVLAKVRRGQADHGAPGPSTGRPRLAGDLLTVPELTSLEFSGLRAIAATFASGAPDFGVVRPLDHLVEENTILMEYVEARTLRQALVARSRLSPSGWSEEGRQAGQVWRRAGAWLGRFQEAMPAGDRPSRQATRADVVDRFRAYDGFLTDRVGPRALGGVAKQGVDLAAEVLPERLPLAIGHGDYAPRNVFAHTDGRLSVFDPMPRWDVPQHEDLCRFLVGMRLLGLQLHSHSLAYDRRGLDHREGEVIRGYHGDLPVDEAQLRCYQLLITLDKWAALVDTSSPTWRTRVRSRSVRLATGYLRGEARRLLDLATSAR